MTRKEKRNGHQTETPDVSHIRNPEVVHETSDVNVRAVLTFVIVLTVATIVVAFAIVLLFSFFNTQEAKEQPKPGPMALSQKERLPPEPRLQGAPGFEVTLESGEKKSLEKSAPQSEYVVLRAQWEENLKTGLKDQSGKVVGMPIDAAIEKIASQGLPSSVKGGTGKLEDFAISLPTAASSGREWEKVQ